jgi:hypothetical protein
VRIRISLFTPQCGSGSDFHFDPDPDPAPHHSDARLATTGLHTLHGAIFSLHASTVSVRDPSWLYFELLQLLNFDFDEDPEPAFY